MTSNCKQNLDYEPGPVIPRRWRRRAGLLVFLGLFVLAAIRWGNPAWHRVRFLYWQRQCLRYAAPPTQLVCDEAEGSSGDLPTFAFRSPDPPCADALSGFLAKSVFLQQASPAPLLFMHERRYGPGGSGKRFLVLVRRMPTELRASVDLPVAYAVALLPPSGFGHVASPKEQFIIEVLPHPFDTDTASTSIRFFAGQPDPNDESHFTIGYEANGRRGTLDGVLRDGDPPWVDLEDRPMQSDDRRNPLSLPSAVQLR